MNTIGTRIANSLGKIEYFLAIIIIIAVFFHFISLVPVWMSFDWSQNQMFIVFLEGIFSLVIGIELARLFISYSLEGVVEVAVFLVARKLLFVDNTLSLLYGAVAIALLFVSLLAVNRFKKS